MKFVSKTANLRIVLKHGIASEPITGRASTPALYVKFENGIVDVREEESVDLMLKHSGFNRDFVMLEDGQIDPHLSSRKSSEPEHNIMELEHGSVKKNINPRSTIKLSSAQQRLVKDMAIKIAQEIAPALAKNMLKDVLEKNVGKKTKEKVEEDDEKITDESLDCVCGFKAKTLAGRKAHQRNCKEFKATANKIN